MEITPPFHMNITNKTTPDAAGSFWRQNLQLFGSYFNNTTNTANKNIIQVRIACLRGFQRQLLFFLSETMFGQ